MEKLNVIAISNQLKIDVDETCVRLYYNNLREHLGASQIGRKCKRYLFYHFRWCFNSVKDARKLRLFNRGHREEERFLEWLREIGCVITDKEADTGKQIRITDCFEHFGGSLDGEGYLPESYEISEKVLFEFKTNGTGKGFDGVKVNGMKYAKEEHYVQTCVYGYKRNLRYVVYCIINKNDDSLIIQLVELDHEVGKAAIEKANQIIFSEYPPDRISNIPTFFSCKYCEALQICHFNGEINKNCRSCKNSKPVENAKWFCKVFNSIIPEDFILTGCENWLSVNPNVNNDD